jgi:hypothetical protein
MLVQGTPLNLWHNGIIFSGICERLDVTCVHNFSSFIHYVIWIEQNEQKLESL